MMTLSPKSFCCRRILVAIALASALAGSGRGTAWAEGDVPDQRIVDTLIKLDREGLWGEAALKEGGVRPIRIVSIKGDSVEVREVIGALQERPASYAIAEFSSLRELGSFRIPLRRARFQPQRSMVTALGLELAVPGGGYFYAGESRQGLALLGFAAIAAATAVTTGKDGVAGWVPIASWFKIASMLHLADEVQAMNATHDDFVDAAARPGSATRPLPRPLLMGWRHRF